MFASRQHADGRCRIEPAGDLKADFKRVLNVVFAAKSE